MLRLTLNTASTRAVQSSAPTLPRVMLGTRGTMQPVVKRTLSTQQQEEEGAGSNADWQSKKFWSCRHTWSRAAANTRRCLVGCSIGDLSMMYALQSGALFTPIPGPGIIMAASMASGISTSLALETVVLRVTEDFTWSKSLTTAFNMSMISMLVMEFAENMTSLYFTQGDVNLSDPLFYAQLVPSLACGFLAPLPYNYYQLKRYGKSCH